MLPLAFTSFGSGTLRIHTPVLAIRDRINQLPANDKSFRNPGLAYVCDVT